MRVAGIPLPHFLLCVRLYLNYAETSQGLRIPSAIVVPLATGMALTITLLTLKQQHDEKQTSDTHIAINDIKNQYVVLWPRIDQKSCLKSIHTAGFLPIPIHMKLDGDELRTGMSRLHCFCIENEFAVLCLRINPVLCAVLVDFSCNV
jgi:hypothetical protein